MWELDSDSGLTGFELRVRNVTFFFFIEVTPDFRADIYVSLATLAEN
jgi:hypothetical protein